MIRLLTNLFNIPTLLVTIEQFNILIQPIWHQISVAEMRIKIF